MGQQSLKHRRTPIGLVLRYRRSGLAPLELVLALPVLLFVSALMVNFGMVATWRVRGEIVSRDAAWRARSPGRGRFELPSPAWPTDAGSGTRGGPQIGDLDHPDLLHAVARGPLPNGFAVRRILDPVTGYYQGHASIVRRYPLLARLGTYRSGHIAHPLLDHPWTCSQMGIGNYSHRTQVLYTLPTTDQHLPRALASAIMAMLFMPNRTALFVLYRDADIVKIRRRRVDFRPRIRHPYPPGRVVVERCQLDPDVVWATEVQRLVDTLDEQGQAELRRISRVPRTLTDYFLKMYQDEVNRLTADIENWRRRAAKLRENLNLWRRELRDSRTPSERRTELNARIASAEQQLVGIRRDVAEAERELNRIRPFLAPLEAYRDRLDEIEDDLRAQFVATGIRDLP